MLRNNETVCLLGPSGGKSTIRIIAGLETAEKGQVIWQGKISAIYRLMRAILD
jgi:ABC-type sulfate/molybdate transport systems ATPase subunit